MEAFLLLTAVLLVYGQCLWHGFVNFDDTVYITDNAVVQRGLGADGVAWAFSTGLTGMWHPLTWLSLMANVSIFGAGAAGFHAMNLALHLGGAWLLFMLLREATGERGRSLTVALLFAVHPLNVESVAWASQRKSTLSTFLCLLALLAWVRYVRTGKAWAYTASLGAFALGLLAKPMIITLPVMMLLMELWPLGLRPLSVKRRLLELAPFALLSAAAAWIIFHPVGPTDVAKGGPLLVASNLLNAPVNVATYLGKLAWPTDLAVLYPHQEHWSPVSTLLASLLLVSITALIAWRRSRTWLVGWTWFLVTLAPVCGAINIGPHDRADRYMYVPAIGLFIALAWSLPRTRPAQLGAGTLIAGFTLLAALQASLWRDSATLWLGTLGRTEPSPTQLVNLGQGLLEAGRLAEAEAVLRQTIQAYPGEHKPLMNLAILLDQQGRKGEALALLERADKLAPLDARIHNHRGSLLQDLGRNVEAEAALRHALSLRTEYAEPWVNLGVLKAVNGDKLGAREAFLEALRINPSLHSARVNLARVEAELARNK